MGERRFDAVIFDMDGVLIDSEYFYLQELRCYASDMGFDVPEEVLVAQVGQSAQSFERLLYGWWRAAGKGLSPQEAVRTYLDWAGSRPRDYRGMLFEGAAETVRELAAAGVRVALASSSPMVNIQHVLDVCGLDDAFEIVVSGEQFAESKPEPDIYLYAIDQLGLPAERCCCVEDSVPGITAGKRAGLYVIARREERFGFSQDAADAFVGTLPEVLELV